MPATFTHPLAILPLRRFCPAWLDLPALVLGSMAPDFGYYLRQFRVATYAHSLPGTFLVSVPSGLLALAVFLWLRRPLSFILPQPHRRALMRLAERPIVLTPGYVLRVLLSLLLGSWTHTVWDSFTHPTGWSAQRLPFLQESLVRIGGTVLPTSYLLQQFSTFIGGALLAWLYMRWLRRQPTGQPPRADSFTEAQRYTLLAVLLTISLTVAIPAALHAAEQARGYLAVRIFVFRGTLFTAALLIPLVALTALVIYARRDVKTPGRC